MVRDQIAAKGYEAFLPTVARWSRWKDRKKKIDWPLFPGYCFARFDSRERLPILKCTGVVSIVSFDGEIAPIPEQEIEGRSLTLHLGDDRILVDGQEQVRTQTIIRGRKELPRP